MNHLKKFSVTFFLAIFLFSCESDVRRDDVVNNTVAGNTDISKKSTNNYAVGKILVNEVNKCGGGIVLMPDPNTTIPYCTNSRVFFWNNDTSLQFCKGCTTLPELIVHYIENYYNSQSIDFKFLPGDANYPNASNDFYHIDANGSLDIDIMQTMDSSYPPSYWLFPIGSALPLDVLNPILQQVLKRVKDYGYNRRVNAILMHYDYALCNMGETTTNGMRIRIKFK